ncbi:MAG: extracellular solute-binding protein [Lachnospiraceae bacterium]|nr:extracellular solute-binding protein [Lachnospiraceae bacterium]
MKKSKRIPGKLLMGALILFFYAPIIYMIVFSFNEGRSLTVFSGFSLKWYRHMLESKDMMEALYTTFSIAILATLISTVVGTVSAIGLSKSKKVIREAVEQMNNLPIMNPDIVTAIGLMLLFITFQVEKGYLTMLLAHVAFCIPYVILSVMPKVRSLDPNLADAAMDLGATPIQALFKVIVPQITPGIISGALIAFTMSVDDFIISYFVTGQGVKNLSIMVYTMSKRINPSINAVSTMVVVIITLSLLLINLLPLILENYTEKGRRRRKIFWAATGAAAVALIGVFVFKGGLEEERKPYQGQVLKIYCPGEYMGENVIPVFEEMTGARVITEFFDSNEQMYIKVANGEAYDILIPSDYMIERLISEKMLQPLQQEKIMNSDLLVEEALGLPYDPENRYSIPYFWGSVGIVYDSTKVSAEELEEKGYEIFLDTKYKSDIYLYDSERDSFMIALKALGYSMNTDSEEELQQAYDWLASCVTTMDAEIVTDEIIDNMAQGRKALGIVYSGDGAYIMSENEDMGYFEPLEGTNLWCDAMVIPTNAQNPDLAHEFMNYLCSYEAAYDNSDFVGYTSPNEEVMEELYSEEGTYAGINAYIPRSGYEKDESFNYNAETKKIISNLWSKVKIVASNSGN